MKKCAFIHVHEGNPEVLENENFLLIQRYSKTEKVIEQYLSQGYEVKHIIPSYTPAIQEEGNYTFYQNGVKIYFEKDSDL